MKLRKEALARIALAALFLTFQLPSARAQKAPSTAIKHSLWRVESRTNTVHLLGSIHFLKKEYYPLARVIEDAYRDSQIVVFEADMEQMQSPAAQAKLLAVGRFSDGQTLKQNISAKTYSKLQSYLAKAIGSSAAFDSFTPWMAAIALSELELQNLGYKPEDGVDNHFFKRAQRDRKELRGFETIDFQISLFTSLSKKDQEEALEEALDDIESSKEVLTEITSAWKTGNTAVLEKLLLDRMADYPQIHKKLLLDRNKKWVPQIEKLLASGRKTLVIVGTAHLIGKESVVDLLQKKGHKIQQL